MKASSYFVRGMSGRFLVVIFLIGHSFQLTHAVPSGASRPACATGGLKKDRGSGVCSCRGKVWYCVGNSNTCYNRQSTSVISCSNGVFGDPQYKARKYCFCEPAGCPKGQHGPVTSCVACEVGRYQSQSNFEQNACHQCPSGQYQDGTGSYSCKSCVPGKYQGSNAQSSCKSCPTGQYQNSHKGKSCKVCLVGYYGNQIGLTSCKGCASGKYQNANQQTSCKNCGAGQYTDQNARTSCKNCNIGQYKGSTSNSLCSACPKGQWQDVAGQSKCKLCNKGQYSTTTGNAGCENCRAGRYSDQTGTFNKDCVGKCDPGYNCPAGSKNARQENCPPGNAPISEWANWYCENGIRQQVPDGKMSTPNNENTHIRTGFGNCPNYHTCSLGIAYANFEWKEPTGCRTIGSDDQSENPVEFTMYEDETSKSYEKSQFEVNVFADDDTGSNSVSYSITGYPNGCGNDVWLSNDGKEGSPTPVNPNFLSVSNVGSGIPSNIQGRLKINQKLNKEDCENSYAGVVTATISGSISNSIKCYIKITILDVNEPPLIDESSLPGHSVPEDSLPATTIGQPLRASDPEADIGLQSLVWTITSCFGVSPTNVQSAQLTISQTNNNCHIRIGACDGQLMVAEGKTIDYETYNKYVMKVKVTDDGTPIKSTIEHLLTVTVDQRNDPPTINEVQTFSINENPNENDLVGTLVASDVDGDSLEFHQKAKTDEPFIIYSNGKVRFVSNSAVPNLNYESGRTTYNLGVTVTDGEGGQAPPTGHAQVMIRVQDINDAPVLTIPPCEGDANSMCISVNENDARAIDLSIWKFDEDSKAGWTCCDSTTPYSVTDWPSDPNGGGCNTLSGLNYGFYMVSKNILKVNANQINYETNGKHGCGLVLSIKDKAGAASNFNVHINIVDVSFLFIIITGS
jgi:hypothetical protein